MNDNKLIELINQKTCNKFSFLKLKQVFFDVQKNICGINLIYPSTQNLTEDDKQELVSIIKQILDLKGALIQIKINKSFVESDLVKRELINFLQNSSPVLYSKIDTNCDIKVEIFPNGTQANVELQLEKDMQEYFNQFNLASKIAEHLNKSFCCEFFVLSSLKSSTMANEDLLSSRISELKAQSEINAILGHMKNKYVVSEKREVVGDEISFNPRYISSVQEVCDNCVVAGTINFLTERTYKSKRTKKNKDGTEERIEKPYFNFTLKDDTANINVVVFPSKAMYHKMHLLSNGNTVLVQGKVERYNEKFEIMAKKISFCTIPNKNEIKVDVKEQELTTYQYVKPIKYTTTQQANLFDETQNYSREVQTQSYVVYDFETTGIDTNQDEIIEIGALKIVNGKFTEVFTTLVKPKKPIPPDATKINRITNEMVAQCYPIEHVICDFYLFCKGCQMVGYNSVAFDSQFLVRCGKKVGLDFDNTQIDVFMLAKEKLKGLKNYKLATVSKYLDVNLIDAHRALNDVIATAEVFLKLY